MVTGVCVIAQGPRARCAHIVKDRLTIQCEWLTFAACAKSPINAHNQTKTTTKSEAHAPSYSFFKLSSSITAPFAPLPLTAFVAFASNQPFTAPRASLSASSSPSAVAS